MRPGEGEHGEVLQRGGHYGAVQGDARAPEATVWVEACLLYQLKQDAKASRENSGAAIHTGYHSGIQPVRHRIVRARQETVRRGCGETQRPDSSNPGRPAAI